MAEPCKILKVSIGNNIIIEVAKKVKDAVRSKINENSRFSVKNFKKCFNSLITLNFSDFLEKSSEVLIQKVKIKSGK
ncbi:hypothetical protein THC_0571 [Caldimicrobium thiodismutans]|uniref:Uncharacterized protein n=1 Tax=Caldimicrobium thiodismutans TaxID=1653476 RepID=A0A0U5BWE0_9BACT|nr:hypothetical protein THC_0571 [Caldimicrobium thiodismutans]